MAPHPVALFAAEVEPRARKSIYPEELASRIGERVKRSLGDPFGLTIFGVNLTTLKPGAMSALRHAHAVQDEFVRRVQAAGVACTVRDTRGREIAAACGQLAADQGSSAP